MQMKKVTIHTLLLLVLAIVITGCKKVNVDEDQPMGKASLSIDNNSQIIIAQAMSKSTTPITDDYGIKITNSSDVLTNSGTYGEFKTGIMLRAGKGYKIYAENTTESMALVGNGRQRVTGQSTFDITAGMVTNVAFTCTMVNTQVSVAFTNAFKAMFINYTVSVTEASNPTREIVYDRNATILSPIAYFGAPAAPGTSTITVKITAQRIVDGVDVPPFSQTIEIKAGEWHKLTFNATQTTGQAGLDITFDDSIASIESSHDIDPYRL